MLEVAAGPLRDLKIPPDRAAGLGIPHASTCMDDVGGPRGLSERVRGPKRRGRGVSRHDGFGFPLARVVVN